MGNLGQSLLHAVGLGGSTAPATPVNTSSFNATPQQMANNDFGVPGAIPFGSSTPVTPQTYVDSLFKPSDTGTPPDANSDAPAFQLHKRTTLGTIADMLLSGLAHGRVAPFANKAYRQNMEEVAQRYHDNPQEAVKMLAQFDPARSVKMQDALDESKRTDEIFNMKKGEYQDTILQRVANLYGAANNDASFQRIDGMAKKYLQAHNMNPDDYPLPTSFQEAQDYSSGQMDPYKRETLQLRADSNTIREANNNAKNAEQHRHNLETERGKGPGAKPTFKAIVNPRTKESVGVMSPDGREARLYDRGSGKWVAFNLTRPGDINTRVFKGYVGADDKVVTGNEEE